MCEYVPSKGPSETNIILEPGQEYPVGPNLRVNELAERPGLYYFECWHPSTQTWEAMLPPTEGLALTMEEGSRVRLTLGTRPEHTKNVQPVEGNMREQLGGKR